ncbi:MAG: zinc ribbon domain-containing protein [Candidatus Omnitrophota bacterium]
MKKCHFCAEEIQDDAIKCRYCGEFFKKEEKEKWYFRTSTLIIGFLCVGPLILPFVWINPRFSMRTKVIVSIIIAAITYYATILCIGSIKTISEYYKLVF